MSAAKEISVLDKKVRLLQPEKGFRTSVDTVLLAAACPVKDGERVFDMGCGVGGVTFCILYRVPDATVNGLEIQPDYVALAERNRTLNEGGERAVFTQGDIRDFAVEDKHDRFDHVVCNPPFLEAGHHIPAQDEGRAKALGHDEAALTVREWVDAGFHALQPGGSLTMIHRADAVDRIIKAMGKRFGAVEILPVWPRAGEAAKRVIVRARKDRKSPAAIQAGLVLHEADGRYTTAADLILREAQAL